MTNPLVRIESKALNSEEDPIEIDIAAPGGYQVSLTAEIVGGKGKIDISYATGGKTYALHEVRTKHNKVEHLFTMNPFEEGLTFLLVRATAEIKGHNGKFSDEKRIWFNIVDTTPVVDDGPCAIGVDMVDDGGSHGNTSDDPIVLLRRQEFVVNTSLATTNGYGDIFHGDNSSGGLGVSRVQDGNDMEYTLDPGVIGDASFTVRGFARWNDVPDEELGTPYTDVKADPVTIYFKVVEKIEEEEEKPTNIIVDVFYPTLKERLEGVIVDLQIIIGDL